jgi:predicted permease
MTNHLFLISMPSGGEWLIVVVGLLLLILPIVAIIDVLISNFKTSTDKLIWFLVVFLLPILGSILYYTIGKKQQIAKR